MPSPTKGGATTRQRCQAEFFSSDHSVGRRPAGPAAPGPTLRYRRANGVVLIRRQGYSGDNADDTYHEHQFDQCEATLTNVR